MKKDPEKGGGRKKPLYNPKSKLDSSQVVQRKRTGGPSAAPSGHRPKPKKK